MLATTVFVVLLLLFINSVAEILLLLLVAALFSVYLASFTDFFTRRLGVALACVGVLVLVLAVIEHARRLRRMEELGLPTVSWFSLPIATTVGLLAIGVTVLVGLGLRGPF